MAAARRTRGSQAVKKLTKSMPSGLADSVNQLYFELEVWNNNRKGNRKARNYRDSKGLKLHLGCGTNYKKGWLNVDLSGEVDLSLDLRRPLPLPDESCQYIYSEHVLEHFEYPDPAASVIGECYRMLEPGGTLSIVVPDGEMVLKAYVLGATEEYLEVQKRGAPDWCDTQMEYLNYQFRQNGQHRFYYDYETLSILLASKGFINIKRREYDSNYDAPNRVFGSLYVICEKPGGTAG